MRKPVVVLTGVDPEALDVAMLGLTLDLPGAVAVRHHIDPVTQVLTRVVSDATGLVARVETDLAHACVGCALREDVLPVLEQLAADDRWRAIVLCLPVAAEADQLRHVLSRDPRLARRLRLSAVVAVVSGERTVDDLLGDDRLADRGRHTSDDDERGVGEAACAQVEAADWVLVDGEPEADATALVRALARPDARVVHGVHRLDAVEVAAGRHEHRRAGEWRLPTAETPVEPLAGPAWRVVLTSERAFHPDRLMDGIEVLGGGLHRSRGCFWVPTRSGVLQEWSGAGGHLSIGSHRDWGRQRPSTRLVVTGLGPVPPELAPGFEDLLLTPVEAARGRAAWRVLEDGLEPWLGDICGAA
ncbi:CobW family GTP-binding protein [Nocardioides litoris]|uniref:CobW family GTP-binding protein n=1 Tax=Nocardioides litoris TaxID=1926648 RepID=UPI001120D368|nr:GTP-binding protein [Nocardioides litoris]